LNPCFGAPASALWTAAPRSISRARAPHSTPFAPAPNSIPFTPASSSTLWAGWDVTRLRGVLVLNQLVPRGDI
jgi:hypothetical protein